MSMDERVEKAVAAGMGAVSLRPLAASSIEDACRSAIEAYRAAETVWTRNHVYKIHDLYSASRGEMSMPVHVDALYEAMSAVLGKLMPVAVEAYRKDEPAQQPQAWTRDPALEQLANLVDYFNDMAGRQPQMHAHPFSHAADMCETVRLELQHAPAAPEPPSKLVTLIERALFDWRKPAADAEAEVAKLRAELAAFKEVSGFDSVDDAYHFSKEAEWRRDAERERDQLKVEVETMQKQWLELRGRKTDADLRGSAAEAEVAKLRVELDDVKGAYNRWEQLTGIPDPDQARAELFHLRADKEMAEAEVAKLRAELASHREAYDALSQDYAGAAADRATLGIERDRLRAEHARLRTEHAHACDRSRWLGEVREYALSVVAAHVVGAEASIARAIDGLRAVVYRPELEQDRAQ